ncbi:MAG: leucine-rich repeat domain-containing protein [Muribaculaceae bacterium]|nr:leucine-rich repeat domain-containing protein [Muribaculaceae bacterium]
MAKKSEIIGEFIVTIHDNGSVEVSRIYKVTKDALKEIWTSNRKEMPEKDWTTQEWGRQVLKEFCGGAKEGVIGEYSVQREDNNRINVIRTYKNTKDGLREVAKELNFLPDPKQQGWNTQRYGAVLVKFAQTGEMPKLKEETGSDADITNSAKKTGAQKNDYPTYEECVAKYPAGPKGDRYKISEDGKTMYDISESLEGSLIVPEGIEVVKFGRNAWIEELTAIVMPDSVKEMRGYLHCCEKLKAIRLSPNMKLSREAFGCLEMEEVTIPEGIAVIPSGAFEYSKLKRVKLPSTLEFICPQAFRGCNLEELVIPENVKVIFPGAFERNEELKKVTFLSDDTKVMKDAFEDCDELSDVDSLYAGRELGDFTFGEDELVYGDVEKKNWRGEVTDVCFELISIPEYYCGPLRIKDGVKEYPDITDYAGITELYIPDSVEDRYPEIPIGVRKVCFPDSLENVRLERMYNLVEFNWPSAAKELRISNSPIASLTIPERVESVYISDMPNLEEVNLPASLETLDISRLPKIKRCAIPESVTELGNGTFNDCPLLEEIILPASLKKVPYRFAIGAWGEAGKLNKVEIPSSVEVIGERAFSNHPGLKRVVIPASVKQIEAGAFADCPNLEEVIIEGNPLVFPGAFENTPGYSGPFVELATVEQTESGLPFLKMLVEEIFFKNNDYDRAYDFLDSDAAFGNCIVMQSLSADQNEYPLDKIGFMANTYSSADGLSDFQDADADACDSMLWRGYFMVAHPEDGDTDFGNDIMEKTASALALILNPESGFTVEEHPYEGPEAIVELKVRELNEEEVLHTYRYHLLEKDGEWMAEKLD